MSRTRKRLWGSLGFAALLGLGGWIWTTKAWRPCEALGGIFAPGRCASFVVLEGRRAQALLQTRAGDILVATLQSSEEPTEPLRLEWFSRATGERLRSLDLPGLPIRGGVMALALSPGETRLALGLLDAPAAVIDPETGEILSRPEIRDAAYLGFEDEDRLLASRVFPRPDRFPEEPLPARRFDALSGAETEDSVSLADSALIFGRGVDAALSADGARLFRALPADREAGTLFVGELSLGAPDPQPPQEPPRPILKTEVRPGCGFLLPRLALAEEAGVLALAYDCPRLRGAPAGIVVWDLRDGGIRARIPTPYGVWREILPLRGENALLTRRHDPDRSRSQIFLVSFAP